MMKKSIRKILIFTVVFYPLCLSAQFTKIVPLACDTLAFDTLRVPLLTYIWEGEFEDYELIDTLKNPHIIEVLFGNNNVRRRIFIKADNSQSTNINYMEDGNLLYLTFGSYYKGMLWWFSGNEYSLMCHAYTKEKQNFIAEFSKTHSCIRSIKTKLLRYWRLSPRHGKPVKYARKLLRIYKSQYKDVYYHLDNCIWY